MIGHTICVHCRTRPVASEWRPFCGERCKLLDLGNWVDGRYRVAGEATSFIDGGKGILRYRGYPIEQLAEQGTFIETAYLLLDGNLPTETELVTWREDVSHHVMLHENIKKLGLSGFPNDI